MFLNEQIYTCGCIDVLSPLQIVGAKNSQLISPIDVIPQEMFQVSNTTLIIESATLMPHKEVARAVNSIIHLEFVTIASHISESLVISLNSHVALSSITFKHRTSHSTIVSLVRSEDNSGSVILASSSLNNGILGSSEPLVASLCTPSTQITWSSFSNISIPTNVKTRLLINTVGKTRIIGCRTESVHSVHDGTITSPINGPGSFLFTNNSFANTDRSNTVYTYPEGDYGSQILPSEADVLFHNCHFKNCESSTGWGGAIFSDQAGQKITITHSSFTSCSCSMMSGAGGAVFLIDVASSISDTLFKDSRSYLGAAAGFHPHENTLSFCSNNCTGGVAEREPTVTTDFSILSQVFSGNCFENNEASERACLTVCVHEGEISHNLFKGNTHTHPEKCRSTLEVLTDVPKSLSMYANKFEDGTFTATTCNGTISSDIGFPFWRQTEQVLFPAVNAEQIFYPSSAQSDTPITPLETANVIIYGSVNADQSFKDTYKADVDSPSPYVQFSRATTLFLSRRKFDFSAKAVSFGAFSGNGKVIIENIQITPNTTTLSTDFISLSTASLIVDKITLDSLPVGSFCFIRMTGESSLVVSQSTFSNFAQTSGSGRSFLVMDGSAAQHTSISSTMFTSLSSAGNGGVVLATLTTDSTLSVEDCVFSSCSSGGNGGAISVSCAAGVPPSSLVVNSTFTSCTCGSGQKGQWVFVEGSSFLTLLERANWLSTVSSLATPTDDNLLWGTDKSELEGSKYRSMTLLYYLLPFRHVTIHSSSEGRDEDGCGRSEWECKSLEVGASHLSGAGSHKLIVATSTTLTTHLSFSTNAIEICPNEATASITTGTGGRLAISAFTLTLTSISFDGQSVERSSSLLEITGSGWIVVSGCSFSSFVKDGDGSIFSSSLNSGNSLTFDNTTFSSCSSSGRGGVLAMSLNGGSFSMTAPISFETCSSTQNEGNWITITSADLVTFLSSSLASLKPSPQTSPYSNLEKKKWFGVDTLTSSDGSLLFYWYPHTSAAQSTHIHADGEDHALCGRESLPCSSFNRTLSQRNTNCKFVVDSAMALEEGLTITADTILTSTTSKQTITSTSAASITVGQISLTLLDLSLTGSSRTSFISLSFASSVVLIGDCSFSSFTLPTALIDFTAGSLSLRSTKFHQIARSDGDGSVLEVEMVEGMELEVDDVELSDVTTNNGDANGFFISFTKITDQSKIPAFSLHNLKYSSSSSSTSEGAFVWIEGNDLDEWIAYGDDRFTGSYETGMSNEWLWTVDHVISLNASLLFYLIPGIGAIGVDESGYEITKCGYHSVWCLSLHFALAKLPMSGSSTVIVQERVEINTTIAFTFSAIISGLTASSQLVVGEDALFEIETDEVKLELSSLVTSLPSALSSASLFAIAEGSLTLSSLSFVSSDAGNVFSSQLIHSTAPLSLTNVNVSSASLSGVALIESWSDVLVDGCRFRSISRSTGLGSVIEANISVSTVIKILHTTFENCRSESTSTWILLKGVNTMASEVSSWEGTLSRSSDRSGVMVADSDYLELVPLIDILFPPAVSSNVFVGGRGIDDLTSCGAESAPCRTISIGFEVGLIRKDSSETVAVSLIDQAGFGGCVWVGSESLLITAGIGRTRLVVEDDLEKDMDGSGVVNVEEGSVTLSDLTLLLPTFASSMTAVRPVSLIFGSGTVLFSNILVSQSSTQSVDLGLCWIVGGSLSLEQVRISQIEQSEDVGLIVAVSETKPLLCSIVESEITRTSTKNSALLVFSSSSPLSQCQILDCLFSHSTNTQRGTQSESAGSLVAISTTQTELSMKDTTFEECWMIPSSSKTSIIHVTVFTHPSHSVSAIHIVRCKFLSSQSASLPSSFIHFSLHSPHACVLFEDSLFSESSGTSTNGGVLIEYWAGLPIVIRRRTVFQRCTVILSEIKQQSSTHQNSQDEL